MDNIFEILKNLTYEKKELDFDSEDIKSDYSQILVNRWISMCEAYLPIVIELTNVEIFPIRFIIILSKYFFLKGNNILSI